MSQEFFKSNIEAKYIKYLLSYTPLPIFPTISSDDMMIEGCVYIYKDKILQCTRTGTFNGIKANSFIDDHLYVNDYVLNTDDDYVLAHWNYETRAYDRYLPDEGKEGGRYPGTGGLTVTDDIVRYYYRPIAQFKVLDDFIFGNYVKNITQRFVSNVSYYDPLTHKFLGEYLRCLRDIYGLDLMGLYNCFDYATTDQFVLTNDGIVKSKPLKEKVYLIPIKFNKTYTIALDCDFPVFAKAVIYKDTLLQDASGKDFTSLIQEPTIRFNGLRFSNPVTYSVTNNTQIDPTVDESSNEYKKLYKEKIETDKVLQQHEKYLYLALQVPKTTSSSIAVIEGDYSTIAHNYISSAESIDKLSDKQLSNIFKSELTLLQSNNKKQIPYADKLISYLLGYTIDCREEIDQNVARIETAIGYNPPLKDFYKGIWDNDLRYTLYSKYMQLDNLDYIKKYDITGFIDRDIDNAVQKGLIKYGV